MAHPRQVDPQAREWPIQLQPIQGRVFGPQPEPERYASPYVMNDGQWTPEEHEAELRRAAQAVNDQQRNRQRREEAERADREHARQMEQWTAHMRAAGFIESPVPQGPPPKGVSSARVLPNVHEALRQNDPTPKAPSTQPSLPKKAPPRTGRGRQQGPTEQQSLHGLVPNRHIQSSQYLLQQLQHIRRVHLLQHFLSQSRNLQHQQR